MKEMEVVIQTAFTKMVESGELNKIIEANVKKSVESVIQDAFKWSSPFQKQLIDYLNNNLAVNFDSVGLAGYNQVLLNIIKSKLDGAVDQYAAKVIGENMDKFLKPAPAEIKLSDLVEEFKKFVREDKRDGRGITCIVNHDSGSLAGYGTVYLSEGSRESERDCKYQLAFTSAGEIYRISLPYSGDPKNRIFCGPFYDFERMLFQLYVSKTRLVLDEDEVSLHYSNQD